MAFEIIVHQSPKKKQGSQKLIENESNSHAPCCSVQVKGRIHRDWLTLLASGDVHVNMNDIFGHHVRPIQWRASEISVVKEKAVSCLTIGIRNY